jgi:hypothetical protein
MNLGDALRSLGECEAGTTLLEQALITCDAALLFFTRDSYPMPWAQLHHNRGIVHKALFQKTADTAHLDRAATDIRAALTVFDQNGASFYVGMAEEDLAHITSRRP